MLSEFLDEDYVFKEYVVIVVMFDRQEVSSLSAKNINESSILPES